METEILIKSKNGNYYKHSTTRNLPRKYYRKLVGNEYDIIDNGIVIGQEKIEEKEIVQWGGFRENAGRKKQSKSEHKVRCSFRLKREHLEKLERIDRNKTKAIEKLIEEAK